jgi:hypothetical protein
MPSQTRCTRQMCAFSIPGDLAWSCTRGRPIFGRNLGLLRRDTTGWTREDSLFGAGIEFKARRRPYRSGFLCVTPTLAAVTRPTCHISIGIFECPKLRFEVFRGECRWVSSA